jgi:endonuclease/exonuclease/phosphatase family metal-dependent hydrolase
MILQKIKNLLCGKNFSSHFCLHDSGKINLNRDIKKYSWAWHRRDINNTEQRGHPAYPRREAPFCCNFFKSYQNINNPLHSYKNNTPYYFPRKLLTWNIQELFVYSNKQKLNNVIRYLSGSNVDVICLQEAFEPDSIRAIINNPIIEYKFPYYLTGDMHSQYLIGENSGLLILSKFPISFQSFFVFNNCMFCDAFSTKGILYFKIGDINFACTHLQSDQTKIAEQQLKLITQHAPYNHNLITLGDFNHTRANSILNVSKNNYSITHDSGRILDYILPLSSDINVSVNVDPINITNTSDHLPLIAEIISTAGTPRPTEPQRGSLNCF